jgi:hypothetical protein
VIDGAGQEARRRSPQDRSRSMVLRLVGMTFRIGTLPT